MNMLDLIYYSLIVAFAGLAFAVICISIRLDQIGKQLDVLEHNMEMIKGKDIKKQ